VTKDGLFARKAFAYSALARACRVIACRPKGRHAAGGVRAAWARAVACSWAGRGRRKAWSEGVSAARAETRAALLTHSRAREPRHAGRSRCRDRSRWTVWAEPEGRSPMGAKRVSMAHKRSSSANSVRISASGARLSTSTPSSAAAASHASPRAQRKRHSRSAPWRLEASAMPRYVLRSARRS